MSFFEIEGGHLLSGSITPQGAKNEALEVISAVLLTEEEVRFRNVPEILDVKNLIELLRRMGVSVQRMGKGEYSFRAEKRMRFIEGDEFVRICATLRGSVMVAGPLLARLGQVYFRNPAETRSAVAGWTPISKALCSSVPLWTMNPPARPITCTSRQGVPDR